MEKQLIIDGNKLINNYMGISSVHPYIVMADNWHLSATPYHRSWNSLMGVVDKIENIQTTPKGWDYCVTIERDFCVISHWGEDSVVETQGEDKIIVVYQTVIKFIK